MNEVKLEMPNALGRTVDWDETNEIVGTFLQINTVKKRDGSNGNVYVMSIADGEDMIIWERLGLSLPVEWIGKTLKIGHAGMNKKYGKGIGGKYTFTVFEITK